MGSILSGCESFAPQSDPEGEGAGKASFERGWAG